MPPGYPCRFPRPFPFFFFVLSSFFLSLLSFSVFPFLFPLSFFVRFVFSSFRFPFFFLYRLLRFSFHFSGFLGGGFCYSVISSWRYTPHALLASLKNAYSPFALFFLAFLMLTYFVLLLFRPFFRFQFWCVFILRYYLFFLLR